MSQLTHSAFLIAMAQFFVTFSVVLVSLPFALIVDSFSQYKFMFAIQIAMCLNALFLCILIKIIPAPFLLLFFIFILGMASAVRMPIGQSAITQTVPTKQIKLAAILNGWGFNIGRTLGPIAAGFLFVFAGPFITFFVIAIILTLSSIYFFYFMKKDEKLITTPISFSILKKRISYIIEDVKNNIVFQHISIDSFFFFLLSTAVWAFLPFYAEYQIHVSAKTQSIMVSMVGVGSILAGLIMPYLRSRLRTKTLQLLVTCLAGISILGFGITKNVLAADILFIVFGLSWSSAVPLFNGEIQACTSVKNRARLIAIYFFVMYLGLAIGNYLTGVGLSIMSFSTFCFVVAFAFFTKVLINLYSTYFSKV